jgi:hypothetical protein
VFLQRHAALPCVTLRYAATPPNGIRALIDARQVQKFLRQQLRLARSCKTSAPGVSYADTHCACISMTDKEHSALLRGAHKICVCATANSFKSGEPILHRERPHIKSRSFLTDDFKNLKSVGLP